MNIAVMQPYLFPYIGYLNLIKHADLFVLYNDVSYIERGWINRNRIISKDGFTTFTMPLKKASSSKLISDIYIDENAKWKNKFLKNVEFTYKKAPFFDQTFQLITNIINYHDNKLDTFIKNSLIEIFSYINIEKEMVFSSDIEYNRNFEKSEKLIEIAQKLSANFISFPLGSKSLYNNRFFDERKIKAQVIVPNLSYYKQFNKHEFKPGLSIIDVLMFNDKSSIIELFNDYVISSLDASI